MNAQKEKVGPLLRNQSEKLHKAKVTGGNHSQDDYYCEYLYYTELNTIWILAQMSKKAGDVLIFLRLCDGTVANLMINPHKTTISALRRAAALKIGVDEGCVLMVHEGKCVLNAVTLAEAHVRAFSIVYITSLLDGGMDKVGCCCCCC